WRSGTRSSRPDRRAGASRCLDGRPAGASRGRPFLFRRRAWPDGMGRDRPGRGCVLEFVGFPHVPSPRHSAHPEVPTMPQFARRMSRAKPSAIMAVAEKAKRLKAEGRDIISFSIGVPNFLPGEHVYAAAREALARDSGQYGSNRGSDALLDAFIAHMEKIGLTGY